MAKKAEYKMVDGIMQLVCKEITEQDEITIPANHNESTSPMDALKEMMLSISQASNLEEIREAAKVFLNITE